MRSEKQFLLDEMQDKIDAADSFILTKYEALTCSTLHDFRQDLGKAGGELEMVRKRVFSKAAEGKGITLEDEYLDGHMAIVFLGKDPIEATKVVFKYGKETGNITVLGGHFDGALLPATQVEALSKLPSQDVLRAQFLGLLEAPMAQTLSVMQALLTSVIYCLDNKGKES